MKLVLQAAYRVSRAYYSSSEGRAFQGVVQGSGIAQALWMIISIFLIKYIYSKNINTEIFTLVLEIMLLLVALIFVDDQVTQRRL